MLGTSVTFNYTGAVQTYTVPADITELQIDCVGAAGGKDDSFAAGKGGRVQCNLIVSAGQTLYLYVGQKGSDMQMTSTSGTIAGGWNGGGSSSYTTGWPVAGGGGSGGGASDIRIGGTTLNDRKVVAGGAGGAGDMNGEGSAGGAGGGLTGGSSGGSSGGTQTAGGTGYKNGGFGQGANSTAADLQGAGGGGGWYGGGSSGNGGGGGSSYTDPDLCTDVIHTQGYSSATGNGWIILTPILPDICTRDSSKDKVVSMSTPTYEAFIAAGYKTDGSVAGVYLKDLNA